MAIYVSKSEFRARVLELLRQVEITGDPVVVTHRGAPKVEVRPYVAPEDEAEHDPLKALHGSVLRYDSPFEPAVPVEDWEAFR